MKRFAFTLESIRDLREQKEKAAQRAYAAAVTETENARKRLMAAEARLVSCWDEWRGRASAGTQVARLEAVRRYAGLLEEQRQQRLRALEAASAALQRAEESLRAASQQRQILEKLRDRQWRAFNARVDRVERQQLDEFGNNGAARKVSQSAEQPLEHYR